MFSQLARQLAYLPCRENRDKASAHAKADRFAFIKQGYPRERELLPAEGRTAFANHRRAG